MVHEGRGAARAAGLDQREDPLGARARGYGSLRQLAGLGARLEPESESILGHAAADLALRQGSLRDPLHRLDRRARAASRARARIDRGSASREHRPDHVPIRQDPGRNHAARLGGVRLLVRIGLDALRAEPLSIRRGQARVRREEFSGQLHRRGPRSDARVVLHAARLVDRAVWSARVRERGGQWTDPRQRRQEDVQAAKKLSRPDDRGRGVRCRRAAGLLDLRPSRARRADALWSRRQRRRGPRRPRHGQGRDLAAAKRVQLPRHLRPRRRLGADARGSRDPPDRRARSLGALARAELRRQAAPRVRKLQARQPRAGLARDVRRAQQLVHPPRPSSLLEGGLRLWRGRSRQARGLRDLCIACS